MSEPLTRIKLRGHRKRNLAEAILAKHLVEPCFPKPSQPLKVICISDTHNRRPDIPLGDLLIHSGDLTENGSFDEVAAGLEWLSSQPHRYKIFVAGNHDVLLDEKFLERYPERRYGQTKTRKDLDWGSVIYLEDESITLDFPPNDESTSDSASKSPSPRSLTIYGSPWTPQYGISAFQYRPEDAEEHWASRLATQSPDILITHGPPRFHLDQRDIHSAGCPYLVEQVARIRPRLMVFGHIHVAYGLEEVVMDGVRRAYEKVRNGWAGWETVVWMFIMVTASRTRSLLSGTRCATGKGTIFVNAAVVGGSRNELRNPAIEVEI